MRVNRSPDRLALDSAWLNGSMRGADYVLASIALDATEERTEQIRAPKPNAFWLSVFLVLFILFMTGCTTKPAEVQTRIVEVPSSKPYRYITYTEKTDETTARQIRRHNKAHSAVIEAEKKAKSH